MKVECPGCHTELDPTNTNCPVCLRPRSRKELLAGLAQTRKPAPTRWGRVLGGIVLGGLAGFAGLVYLNRPAPPPAPAPNPAAAPPAPAAPAPAAAATPDTSGAARVVVQQTPLASAAPAAEEEPQDEAPAAPRARKAARPKGWLVEGSVYDLLSLKPVPGAKIVFQDKNSGAMVTAVTDAGGRYKADLPKVVEGGYEVTIARRGYSSEYLEEMSPPYRSQSRGRRLEAAEELQQSAVLHVPLLPEYSASGATYDAVLFPRR
jgi:pyruvate/2-oxoglutarate dehydrogenase complex dihydrolipoamide acyltransferase (E2) component